MVKTIRGLLTLKELKELLTEYARKLPAYTRVENDEISIIFQEDRIRLELRTKKERECWNCKGTGKDESGESCWACKGTGKEEWYDRTIAYIKEYDSYPHYGMLKIEVQTDGRTPEIWKPEVEAIKTFIENLVGKKCIIVPSKGSSKPQKVVSISDLANQKELSQFFGGL